MRLTDDGATVVLDLHGATVDEALRVARQALGQALRAGRHRLDLVHGASTTHPLAERRTIKQALHAWVALPPPGVQQVQHRDAVLSLYLDLTARRDGRRLTLRDVLAGA